MTRVQGLRGCENPKSQRETIQKTKTGDKGGWPVFPYTSQLCGEPHLQKHHHGRWAHVSAKQATMTRQAGRCAKHPPQKKQKKKQQTPSARQRSE